MCVCVCVRIYGCVCVSFSENCPEFNQYVEHAFNNVSYYFASVLHREKIKQKGTLLWFRYSIHTTGSSEFCIDDNGTIFTVSPLDREMHAWHNLSVKAREQGKASLGYRRSVRCDARAQRPKLTYSVGGVTVK